MDFPQETILGFIDTLHNGIKKRNTITVQEFTTEGFYALYHQPTLDVLDPAVIDKINRKFQDRFSLFDPIIVTDSAGVIAFELSPTLIQLNTWNNVTDCNLGVEYNAALEKSNPLTQLESQVFVKMMEAVDSSINKKGIANYVLYREAIEKKYGVFKSQDEPLPESNTLTQVAPEKIDEPLIINTKGMF